MTDPLLRRATPTDTPAIIDLHHAALRSVGADAGPGPWDDDLNDIRRHYLEPGGEFLVLESNAQIIAMGALRRTGPTTGEIKRMRVHPDHQGAGYGRLLLNTLEERAASRGIRELTLDTTERQAAAIGLYWSSGYEPFQTGTVAGMRSQFFRKSLM